MSFDTVFAIAYIKPQQQNNAKDKPAVVSARSARGQRRSCGETFSDVLRKRIQ